ncbi:potassium-transporting ATPase subunit C [Rouxiella silvae]|uniref:Potassium-transporting ATPase KdpC subunit n=1 Tax=Rouxiella silvae TaxID=1646373 RepID=A0AA40WYC5_9GAMM|nr:potassium-transporting ATPase subunit KdpC [Rouxiella silvae]KQN47577.1 potassium-transporting ATPase subunit C [Serratia sp. Leaf50]MBF6635390.1 potassium-transporting ATPase subunit KdpC [Rouxiella silvae]ORJ19101.1 potassium-transporting ATPase subunit C [Rouxiella silvae]
MTTATRHSYVRPSLVLLGLFTLITGVAYPMLTTGLSDVVFRSQAQGSIIFEAGKPVGSALIGQNFTRKDYFWGRPSATSDSAYNPLASSGSNLAVSNPALDKAVADHVAALRAANPQSSPQVPVDLVTASASGLDPHISVAAARWQAQRVAAARKLPQDQVDELITQNTSSPLLSFIGDPVVNVLQLNLALDKLTQ